MLQQETRTPSKETYARLLAELEACFIAIVDINLPDLEEQVGKDDPLVREIRETCLGGLAVVEKLAVDLLL